MQMMEFVKGTHRARPLPQAAKPTRLASRKRVAFLEDEAAKAAVKAAAELTEDDLRAGSLQQRAVESMPFGVVNDLGASAAFLALFYSHVAQRVGSIVNARITLSRPLPGKAE